MKKKISNAFAEMGKIPKIPSPSKKTAKPKKKRQTIDEFMKTRNMM